MSDLEKRKLELEIQQLEKPWWQNVAYLQILLPATIALGSLLYAIFSGFFSTKYEQLQLQREQLRLEILYFEQKKDSLTNLNGILSTKLDSSQKNLTIEQTQRNHLLSELIQYQNKLRETQSKIEELGFSKKYYETEISALQKDYILKKEIYQKELRTKYFNETALRDSLDKILNKLEGAQRKIAELNYQWALTDKAPMLKKNKLDFDLWINDQMIDYYTNKAAESQKKSQELEHKGRHFKNQADSLDIEIKLKKLPR